MTSTVLVTLPVTTVTIDTTYQRTSFLTIKVTVVPLQLYGTTTKSLITTSATAFPTIQSATSDALQSSQAPDPTVSLPSVVVGNGQQTSLMASTTPNNTAPTDVLGGAAATAAPTVAPPIQQKQMEQHEKNVIIGSLCGAIAAFLAIGLLICMILRCRYRRRQYSDHTMENPSMTEKGMMTSSSASTKPAFMTKWKAKLLRRAQSSRDLAVAAVTAAKPAKRRHRHRVSGTGSPLKCGRRPPPPPGTAQTNDQSNTSSVTVDEDHHIIRMSTHHWPRPYARGQSYRDSLPPGVLRVTNPDRSLPPTPRDSCSGDDLVAMAAAAGGAGGDGGAHGGRASSFKNFLRRPKPAFIAAAAAVGHHHHHNSVSRSRASSWSFDALASAYAHGHGQPHQHQQAQGATVPSITIDASLSQECIPSQGQQNQQNPHSRQPSPVPSFSSYPSLTSMHTVRQRPPEDPFFQPASTSAATSQQRPPGTSHTLPLPPRSDRSVWPTAPTAAAIPAASATPSDRRGSFASTLDSGRSRFGGGTSRLLQALRTRAWSNSRFDGRAAATAAPPPRVVEPTPPLASRRSTGTGLSMWSFASGDAGAGSAATGEARENEQIQDTAAAAQQQQQQERHQQQQHLLAAQQLWARRSDPFDLDRASLRSDPAAESSSDGATTIETLPLAAEKEIESGGAENWTTRIMPQHITAATPRSLYEGT